MDAASFVGKNKKIPMIEGICPSGVKLTRYLFIKRWRDK